MSITTNTLIAGLRKLALRDTFTNKDRLAENAAHLAANRLEQQQNRIAELEQQLQAESPTHRQHCAESQRGL